MHPARRSVGGASKICAQASGQPGRAGRTVGRGAGARWTAPGKSGGCLFFSLNTFQALQCAVPPLSLIIPSLHYLLWVRIDADAMLCLFCFVSLCTSAHILTHIRHSLTHSTHLDHSSNLTFSLAPGWAFVETEDWRKDIQCAWAPCSGDPGAFVCGWVYCTR